MSRDRLICIYYRNLSKRQINSQKKYEKSNKDLYKSYNIILRDISRSIDILSSY